MQKNPMNPPTLGLDLAQATFVAALYLPPQTLQQSFTNSPTGFRKLGQWLHQHFAGGLRVGLESTSTYGEKLAEWLHAHGHTVCLLNPERVACYAKAIGQRNKTDPADAGTIARFVARHEDLTVWTPPPPEQKSLRSLTRARHQLTALATAVSNQLKTAGAEGAKHLGQVLQTIRTQLKALAKDILAHLRAHPVLQEQVRRLTTFTGVGFVTAAVLIAELPPVTAQTDPRTLCAWAGLTPKRSQSGPREGRSHLSRKGNAYVRQALYMPALVAKRFNPLLHAFAQDLASRGKTNRSILGALSHKMLRILVGMLRTNTDFDAHRPQQKI
jgi:transposase